MEAEIHTQVLDFHEAPIAGQIHFHLSNEIFQHLLDGLAQNVVHIHGSEMMEPTDFRDSMRITFVVLREMIQ